MAKVATTPVMKQFETLKEEAGDALLFFRMGDFYELFGPDAVEASKILQIVLTSRDKNKELPMAGVPHHSAENYILKLLQAGKKVALAEQIEKFDPKGKKTFDRKIVKTFTPAIQFHSEEEDQKLLACITSEKNAYYFTTFHPTSGEIFYSDSLSSREVLEQVSLNRLGHLLLDESIEGTKLEKECKEIAKQKAFYLETFNRYTLSDNQEKCFLKSQTGLEHPENFISESKILRAWAMLLWTVVKSQKIEKISYSKIPKKKNQASQFMYGKRTEEHLDLFPKGDGKPNLFDEIKETKTALGSRLLKRWIETPLLKKEEIEKRQTSILEFHERHSLRDQIQKSLDEIYDLERLAAKLNSKLFTPKDLLALSKSLSSSCSIPHFLKSLSSSRVEELKSALSNSLSHFSSWTKELENSLEENPPLSPKEGGIFKKGVHPELDRLRNLNQNGEEYLLELEKSEREKTKIPTLKVKYNRVSGYYIEVTKTHLDSVPLHYIRRQSTVNAERYITEELKKFEDEILNSQTRQRELEFELFCSLLERLEKEIEEIGKLSQTLAELDVLCSLSKLKDRFGWIFPTLTNEKEIHILRGRHPVVEKSLGGKMIPNSLDLSSSEYGMIITGPNMGGKSTVMRMVAILTILAQMGAPLPAESATLGIVTSLHTRIGAHDAISEGQSTFMVEMSELAHLLQNSTENSLLILDEIGRGTSTYDGMSVAWATLEWLMNHKKARTLFATHYHELTTLPETVSSLINMHVRVDKDEEENLLFRYELGTGPASESFGIHVAKSAGLPSEVIDRAWGVLGKLESEEKVNPENYSSKKKNEKNLGLNRNLSETKTSQLNLNF